MNTDINKFTIGEFRPIYFWVGKSLEKLSSIQLQSSLFSPQVKASKFQEADLEKLLEMNCNFFFLMYNCGLPFSIEQEDFEEIKSYTAALKDLGFSVIFCIQFSNCIMTDEFAGKNWYALKPNRQKFQYFGAMRFLTCINNKEWQDYLEYRIDKAVELGADGIFFCNIAFGTVPGLYNNHWVGAAGCFCDECQESFSTDIVKSGKEIKNVRIPNFIDLSHPLCKNYLIWRNEKVKEIFSNLSEKIKLLKSDAMIMAGSKFVSSVNSFLHYGLDIKWFADNVDAFIIDNNNLSKLEKTGLTYDSITFKLLKEHSDKIIIATTPQLESESMDTIYSPNMYKVSIAEAASCGGFSLIKNSGYKDLTSEVVALLSDGEFEEHRASVGIYNNWFEKNIDIFSEAKPFSRIGVFYPYTSMIWEWEKIAPYFFKTLLTYTELHIPFRVVCEENLHKILDEGIKILVLPNFTEFDETQKSFLEEFSQTGIILLLGNETPRWTQELKNFKRLDEDIFIDKDNKFTKTLYKNNIGKFILSELYYKFLDIYFNAPHSPNAVNVFGFFRKTIVTPEKYAVPEKWKILYDTTKELIKEADDEEVIIDGPPFIQVQEWRNKTDSFFHIVNLLPGFSGMPNAISVRFPYRVSGRISSPDENKIIYPNESIIVVPTNVYSVLQIKNRGLNNRVRGKG